MRRFGFQFRMIGALLTLMIIIGLGTLSCSGVRAVQKSEDRVEILAEVLSATPLPTGETVQRKRWSVELRVLEVIHGKPDVKPGDAIVVQVHSVVKMFGDDFDTVKGKKFRVRYVDVFSKDYRSDITVDLSELASP